MKKLLKSKGKSPAWMINLLWFIGGAILMALILIGSLNWGLDSIIILSPPS